MNGRKSRGVLLVTLVSLSLVPLLGAAAAATPSEPSSTAPPPAALRRQLDQAYGKLPLTFEENRGQIDSRVKFFSRGPGYTLFLTPTEATFVITKSEPRPKRDRLRALKRDLQLQAPKATRTVMRMKLVGANSAPNMMGRAELPGKVNYFIGSDPKKWRTNVPTYARVEYRDVYPGVNLVYYGNQRQLEYDFIVAPGADPTIVRLAFEGVDKLRLNTRGDLLLHTPAGELRQPVPLAYQTINGQRRDVSVHYSLKAKDRVGFRVAAYDRTRPLVIDPVLAYSTHLGDDSQGNGIAVDSSGNAYVTGSTGSVDFPSVNALQPVLGGAPDVFVAKLNPAGSALIYSTYLGGSGSENSIGVAVDAAGNAHVVGFTGSPDFPTANALQSVLGGNTDAFVAKLNPSGSMLVYSTYLGGSSDEVGSGIAVDGSGNAYVTGYTFSPDFPTVSPFQPAINGTDTFVAKLNPTGSLIYSTFLGGHNGDLGNRIAVDASGNAYVTGVTGSPGLATANAFQTALNGASDIFVAKLNPAGTGLIYFTYLGGSDLDSSPGIAVDASGNAYVTGHTFSTDFPTVNPLQPTLGGPGPSCSDLTLPLPDAFVVKLNPAGSAAIYSTYLGGNCEDYGWGIAVDAGGNAYVIGDTTSLNFPTVNPLQATSLRAVERRPWDVFVAKLNPEGSALVYSTFLGGSGNDSGYGITVDSAGNAYVIGQTTSDDFPTVNPVPLPPPTNAFAYAAKLLPSVPSFNTSVGSNVTVPVGSGVGVTFSSVSVQGNTSTTTSSTGPTPPAGFSLGTPPTYYDIMTTTTFSAPVKVCVRYDPDQFSDPSSLHLLHFESNAWVDITTSNNEDSSVICGQVTSFSPFVIAQRAGLTALGPASVWVGLKNSDDVGIRFDLRAEVYRNGTTLVGSGEVASVPGGSSGFNNAKLNTIPLTLTGAPLGSGDTLVVKLLVRNACTGSGKNSGNARLWFNDSAANTRFDATIASPATYYLRDGFALATAPGPGPKKTIDVAAGSKCSAFKSFGSWSITVP